MELIKTDNTGRQVVSARDLHAHLESKRDYSSWIKQRISKYGLIENQDYTVFTNLGENPSGGRPSIDYALTIEAAKELAMVEGNAKGKAARQYFIECERKARESEQPKKQLTPAEMLLVQAQQLVNMEREQAELKAQTDLLEKRVDQIAANSTLAPDYYQVIGYAKKIGVPVSESLASVLGRKASKICRERGLNKQEMHHPKHVTVGLYPESVLREVFNDYIATLKQAS